MHRLGRARLYLAQDDFTIVVARHRLRTVNGEVVRHGWPGLVDTVSTRLDRDPARTLPGAAIVVLPPLLVTLAVLAIGPELIAILAGILTFFLVSYLIPAVRRWRPSRARGVRAGTTRVLVDGSEQVIFARAVAAADRISDTWPALGALVDVADADAMLVEALWELSGVLVRRQELRRVLADLNRPEFTGAPADDDTVRELHRHRHTARVALAGIDAEIARREANLARAEQAGLDFIREQRMRQAIRSAEQSLEGLVPPPDGSVPPRSADTGAELAEQTASVLAAYRELTAGPDRPSPDRPSPDRPPPDRPPLDRPPDGPLDDRPVG